ncbi:MAG: ClpXP protease specificity-enhancing factor SspB, partial [Polaromonas sp.]
KARFGGAAREILVPISHVIAIYARENGQGMAFPLETIPSAASESEGSKPAAPVLEVLSTDMPSSETPDNKIMQLVENVPSTKAGGKSKKKNTDSPEPPKPPTRPRPSLKSVK